MQCVILAGGLGTRMQPWTETVPKALIPVAGRPFVDHQLDLLASRGVTEVLFAIGYRGDMIRAHVRDGRRWGLAVDYVEDGDELRGTAGALRVALEAGRLADTFLLLYGDSYLPVPYRPVHDAFVASGAAAMITVFRNADRWDTSNVVFEAGRVVVYDKRREDPRSGRMAHIDYGLGVLTSAVVDASVPQGEVVDLADVYHRLSLQGALAGFEVTERFYEVGSPEGLAELEALLASPSACRPR